MQAVKILVKEHEVMLEMLDNLAAARNMLEKGEQPPKEFFEKAVGFARDFADKFHHFKEEYLLFGLLAQKKDGAIDAEIGLLRHEHERGRKFINNIAGSIEGYVDGDGIATTRLLENLAAYISILKRHIHSENHVFFKMAEQDFSDNEEKILMVQFQKDQERMADRNFFGHSRKLVSEMSKLIGK
jgi:hemerythrin-like domain-containing protein